MVIKQGEIGNEPLFEWEKSTTIEELHYQVYVLQQRMEAAGRYCCDLQVQVSGLQARLAELESRPHAGGK